MGGKKPKKTPSCDGCNGICCRHIALEIEEPTSKRQYDHIIWYLLHEGISVFVEGDGKWYLEFSTPCSALDARGRCTIYDERPRICREYAVDDCVRHVAESEPLHEFHTREEFIRYLDEKGIRWRFKRQPS